MKAQIGWKTAGKKEGFLKFHLLCEVVVVVVSLVYDFCPKLPRRAQILL